MITSLCDKFLKISAALLIIIISSTMVFVPVVQAASASKIESRSTKTLNTFKNKVEGSSDILSKAKGLLIMPAIYQGGIGVGGRFGEGALKIDSKTVDYYNLIGASYGFQLGGQKKSLIVAFMDDNSLNEFRNSKGFEFGVNASAAVITVGADGRLNVNDLNKPILAFVVDQKGLMYDLSLAGSKFTKISK